MRILVGQSPRDARFEEELLLHLSAKGLTVPRMVTAGKRGHVVSIAPRQQLSVFQHVPGRQLAVFEIDAEHARQVGDFLATMHESARGFARRRKHKHDPARIARLLERSAYEAGDSSQLRDLKILALELVRHNFTRELPRGIIHGDLSVDNVRFARGKLCGVLDFDHASVGPLVYDIAIAIVDWAFLHDQFIAERARAIVAGYQSRRPLEPPERGALYDMCRYAATRFGATRFYEFEARGNRARKLYKDYRHYMTRLNALRELGPQLFRDQVFGRQPLGRFG
jgi:homoserine kinase type II